MVSNKNRFALPAMKRFPLKIEAHIKSRKHATAKERLQLAIKRDADIAKALREYDSTVHPVGEGLAESTRIYRVKGAIARVRVSVELTLSQPRVATVVRSRLTHR